MKGTTDLRVKRTKQMIREAFFSLIDTIGFEKVTVNDLAQKALINRSTFYLHYTDKYDLLNKVENEMLEGLEYILQTMPEDILLKRGFGDKHSTDTLRNVFEYVKENRDFFTLILSEKGNPAFMHKLAETIKRVMTNKNMLNKLQIPESYAIAIISGIQTSVIGNWIKTGMNETPEELAAIMGVVLRSVPKSMFGAADSTHTTSGFKAH